MKKSVLAMIALLGAAGCYTTREIHTAGPFVRSIQARPGELVVDTCAISHIAETEHDVFGIILEILTLGQGQSSSSTTHRFLEQTACGTSSVPTGDVP